VCSRAYRHINHISLLNYMGLELLSVRRKCHKLNIYFKMVNYIMPDYLNHILPQQVGHASQYNLRNASSFRVPLSRTLRFRKSFLPSTTKAWNNLEESLKHSCSLSNFKHNFFFFNFVKSNKLLLYGSNHGAINQARIRMGHSG
jgi:hypothetical protein